MKGLNISNLSTKPTQLAEFSERTDRTLKDTDIVLYSKSASSRIKAGSYSGHFKAKSFSGPFAKLRAAFSQKADAQDIYNICRSHGMTTKQAGIAMVNIKLASDKLGLSGFSAKALNDQLELLNLR
jgi:hypothetical protein